MYINNLRKQMLWGLFVFLTLPLIWLTGNVKADSRESKIDNSDQSKSIAADSGLLMNNATCLVTDLCFEDLVKVTDLDISHGLAVGYIDSDTDLDYVVASYFLDQIRMETGCGDGTFCSTLDRSMGDYPIDVGLADFNSDGRTDIIAVDYDNDEVIIRSGHNNYSSSFTYSTGNGPTMLNTADLNNDGVNDFATLNKISQDITVRLWTGAGFGPMNSYATSFNGTNDMQFGDCDADGDLDMFYTAADPQYSYVRVRLNNGEGVFGNATNAIVSDSPYAHGLTLGDYNEDGDLDIIVTLSSNDAARALGNGACGFANEVTDPVGQVPNKVRTADFDQDGHLDFVIGHAWDGPDNVSIYLGRGDGNFSGPYHPDTGMISYIPDIEVGDFNNDGKPDIIFTEDTGVYILNSGQPPVILPPS